MNDPALMGLWQEEMGEAQPMEGSRPAEDSLSKDEKQQKQLQVVPQVQPKKVQPKKHPHVSGVVKKGSIAVELDVVRPAKVPPLQPKAASVPPTPQPKPQSTPPDLRKLAMEYKAGIEHIRKAVELDQDATTADGCRRARDAYAEGLRGVKLAVNNDLSMLPPDCRQAYEAWARRLAIVEWSLVDKSPVAKKGPVQRAEMFPMDAPSPATTPKSGPPAKPQVQPTPVQLGGSTPSSGKELGKGPVAPDWPEVVDLEKEPEKAPDYHAALQKAGRQVPRIPPSQEDQEEQPVQHGRSRGRSKAKEPPKPLPKIEQLKNKALEHAEQVYATLATAGDLEEIDRLIVKFVEKQNHFTELGFQVQPGCIYVVDVDHRVKCWSYPKRSFVEPKLVADIFVSYVVFEPKKTVDMTVDATEDRPGSRRKGEKKAELKTVSEKAQALEKELAELKQKEAELLAETEGSSGSLPEKTESIFVDLERSRAKKTEGKMFPQGDDGPSTIWRSMRSTHTAKSSSKPASSSKDGSPSEVSNTDDAVCIDGEEYVWVNDESKTSKAELEATRRSMYARQCKDGKFYPGPQAKYDVAMMEEQVACSHPENMLRWGRNQHAVYASCGKCRLKSVILYKKKKEPTEKTTKVFMVDGQESSQSVSTSGPLAMIDTGCRRSVAGRKWHQEMQEALRMRNMRCHYRPVHDQFQFGPGTPVTAVRRWTYPVVLGDSIDETLEISEINEDVPALIGPDDLAKWSAIVDFTNATIKFHRHETNLIEGKSGHPCIHLLNPLPEMTIPIKEAYMMADEEDGSDDDDEFEEVISDYEEHALKTAKRKDWWYDEEDGDESEHEPDGDDEDELVSSGDDSSSSVSDEPALEETSEDYMSKGGRRQLRSNLKEIAEAYALEAKSTLKQHDVARCSEDLLGKRSARTPGPWRVMQFFAMTLAFTQRLAVGRGWDLWEPITLQNGFDLSTRDGRMEARKYIQATDPDLIVMTPPTTLSMKGQGSPMMIRADRDQRQRQHEAMTFAVEVFRWQAENGRVAYLEGPLRSTLWTGHPMQSLLLDPQFGDIAVMKDKLPRRAVMNSDVVSHLKPHDKRGFHEIASSGQAMTLSNDDLAVDIERVLISGQHNC